MILQKNLNPEIKLFKVDLSRMDKMKMTALSN